MDHPFTRIMCDDVSHIFIKNVFMKEIGEPDSQNFHFTDTTQIQLGSTF